jgi:hypothetical protein
VIIALLSMLVSFTALAQEESSTEAAAISTPAPAIEAPKWRLNFSTYYFAFEGERGAVTNLYDFGDINTRMDFLNINYALPKNWSFNVLFQHFDSYIESKFPSTAWPWAESNDRITGFGDTYFTTIAPLKIGYPVVITADFGLSVPTGAIDYNAVNLPGLESFHLAYNAQLGSGTVDGLAGATILYLQPNYQFGSRVFANIRTGINKFGYRLGNQYRLDMWYDYNFPNGFTPRLAGYYRYRDPINGFDETRGNNPADNFFFNKQINWDISVALRYQKALGKSKMSFNAEVGVPVAQKNINVDNSFVKTLYYGSLGLNAAF